MNPLKTLCVAYAIDIDRIGFSLRLSLVSVVSGQRFFCPLSDPFCHALMRITVFLSSMKLADWSIFAKYGRNNFALPAQQQQHHKDTPHF